MHAGKIQLFARTNSHAKKFPLGLSDFVSLRSDCEKLLNQAIESIVQTKDVSDLDSFLSGVQADLFSGQKVMPDDFVLIDFLVIKGGQGLC